MALVQSTACDGWGGSLRFASLWGRGGAGPFGGPPRPSQMQMQRKSMAAMAANELGPMLTASEVAEMLHLHVNTVKRLGDRGELPFYRVCKRGDRRFRLEDVMTFLDKNRQRQIPGSPEALSDAPSRGQVPQIRRLS